MKKSVLFFVLIAFVVLFSIITGCSSKKNSSPTTPAATPVPTIDSSALVSVPGGTFYQTDGTNGFTHTISAFKIGKYQVTYELWYTVYQWAINNGFTFQNAGREGSSGTDGAAPTAAKFQPVIMVNWRDTIVWCNAYSLKTGLTPVYYSEAGFTTPIEDSTDGAYGASINTTAGSYDNPFVNWSANGYRLPTEGEYQCAASYIDGSSWTPYDYASGATDDYTDLTATELVGWCSEDSGFATHDVGSKKPNALGIYDMSGNVYEWCWDCFGNYPGTSTDYRGAALTDIRVARGGCFDNSAAVMPVGNRGIENPYYAMLDYGFRFARTY